MIKTKILILLILLTFQIDAQVTSIYSRYGIGNLEYSGSARNIGLGGLGITLEDKDFINSVNPAGWSNISLTRVEFASSYFGVVASDNINSNYYSAMDFNGFSIAIPVSNSNGVSVVLGLHPYSKVNYKANSITAGTGADDFNSSFTGEGGLSKLFIGSSYRFPIGLSVGAELDYYFGNLIYKNEISFPNSTNSSALFEKSFKTKGLGGTFGLISPNLNDYFDFKGISSIKLGVTYSLTAMFSTDSVYFATTSFTKDTTANGITETEIPSRLGIGLAIKVNKYSSINVDYSRQSWSEYRFGNTVGDNLQDVNKFGLGFEYRVNPDGIDFSDLVIWRLGFSYENTPFKFNGNSINQLTLMGGVSLPMGRENTIDLGILYAKRGMKDLGLVDENIIGFNLSLSFGELWFLRQER